MVRLEREGTTAWVRWSRPERRNAFDPEALRALGDALEEAAGSDARAIVCLGEGGHWSAGDDLRASAALDADGWAAAVEDFNRLTRVVVAAPQPVVAAIDGACIGGAFEFAYACDLRLASPRVRLGCPEASVGLSVSNGFTLLAPRAARWVVLTGAVVGAEEALRLGLVDAVVEDPEAEARRAAERIARLSRAALAGMKRLFAEAEREALARALEGEAALCRELFALPDAHEGFAAFLEKREPRFA